MSLTGCISKAGAGLRQADKAAILARATALRRQGLSPDDAGRRAVNEQIAVVQSLLAEASRVKVPSPVPSRNTIFTDDAAAKARAILRRKLGQLNSGLDPELLQAGITLAGYHIERGARDFAAYARAMLADLGDAVRPYLKSWYMALEGHPGFGTASAAGPEPVGKVRDAGADEVVANRVAVVASLLGDGSQRKAISEHGFERLGVEQQQRVLAQVRRGIEDLEVLRVVVDAVPVDVMNMLVGTDGATDLLRGNVSVLRDALAGNHDAPVSMPVARVIDALAAFVEREGAFARAEGQTAGGQIGGPPMGGRSALQASYRGHAEDGTSSDQRSLSMPDSSPNGPPAATKVDATARAGGPDPTSTSSAGDASVGPSSLNEAAPAPSSDQTKTEAFKRWFGDSKVVDAEGRPLVMYHGTNASQDGDAFTMFDAYGSNYGLFGQGAYFTDDPAVASSYTTKGKGTTPTVYPVYMSIQNPVDMDAPADRGAWEAGFPNVDFDTWHEGGDTNESFYRAAEADFSDQRLPKWEGAEAMQEGLRKMGFDGITHVGGGRVKSEGIKHRVFIAFDPEQIKSATGNRGTFDQHSADIRLSQAPTTGRGEPSADLRRGTGRGLPVETVRAFAARLAADGNVKINVAATVADMPAPQRAAILKKAPNGLVRGAYFRSTDQIWLVAENLHSFEDMVFVAMHEAFHRGLHITLGEDGAHLLRQIYATNKKVRDLADENMRRFKIGKEEAVNEALADLAGKGELRNLNGWPRLLRMIKEWLAKIFDKLGIKLNFTDDMVADLVAGLRREGLKGGVSVNVAEDAAPLASRTARDAARWQATGTNSEGPEFYGNGIGLIAFRRLDAASESIVDGVPQGHAAEASGGTIHEFVIANDTGDVMGHAILEVDAGNVTTIHAIDITGQRRGVGRQVVQGILANAPGPVKIIHIVPSAEGFWTRMGVSTKDSHGNATTTWQALEAADSRRAHGGPQGAREGLEADPGATGQAEGTQAAAGEEDGPLLSQAAPTQARRQTQAPAPQQRSAWRDATNRLQFAPGQVLYDALGRAASPLLNKLLLKPAPAELRAQLRQMKLDVEKAQEKAVAVAREMQKLSPAEREMVSGIIEKELAAGFVPPAHAVRLAKIIADAFGAQSKELVRLGMLSQEAVDRWDGAYLPRFYESKLRKQVADAWADALARTLGRSPAMKGIKGKHLKGRGLFETIPSSDLPSYQAMGWEVRDPGFDPAADREVQVWRDYTREERDKMGEIRDAAFRFVMGYMQSQRDIALGRLFEGLASNPEMSSRTEREGWVRVPDGTIDGTGVNRYGQLAGKYVPKEVLSQLSQTDEAQSAAWTLYRKGMAMWKLGKTALNPVSHVNNIISNLSMAHFAGVGYHRADKYVAAIRDFATKSPALTEAKDAGLFVGTLSEAELLDTLPTELQELAGKADSKVKKGAMLTFDLMTFFLRKPMGAAYQAEDTFFRYLIYKDARERGLEQQAAVDYAQRYIFTYDDLPKGARMVRDFAIPFVSYTYKAIPALLHTALVYPWRFAAPAGVLWAANAAAYAIATGDDDEGLWERLQRYLRDPDYRAATKLKEQLEREHLPEWMKGSTALGTPKAIRLGTDEVTKLPMFLDTSRLVPGGDVFDINPNAGGLPIPQPITPSHPLFTAAVAMLANKDLWTGKDLTDSNDTIGEKTAKRSDWIWKQASPAISVGNIHWERGMNALAQASGGEVKWLPDFVSEKYTGIGRDGLPVQPKYAAMQTFGIKARPIDLDLSEKIEKSAREKMIRDIDAEISRLHRLNLKGAVSDKAYDQERDRAIEKKSRLRDGLTVDGDPKQ